MAGIEFQGRGSAAASNSATSLTPAKPATAATDTVGVLIAIVDVRSNATITTATAGWTKLSQTNSGAGYTQALFIAPTSAAAPLMTWTGAVACSARIAHFSDCNNPLETTIVGASSVATGSTSTIAATSINTTKDNSSVIVITGVAAGGNSGMSPAGWEQIWRDNLGTPSRSQTGSIAYLGSSGSPSPSFSISAPSASAWVANEIELLYQDPAAAISASSADITRVQNPEDGMNAASSDIATVQSHGSGISTASAEAVALQSSGLGIGVGEAEVVLILRPAPPRKHFRLNIN